MNSTKANLMTIFFFLFSCVTLLSLAAAQSRAPHGLANEDATTFSPSAYDFFHPATAKPNSAGPCGGGPSCSPFPLAAQVNSVDRVLTSQKSAGLGGGAIAGIVMGLAFVALTVIGVYYVVATRRNNVCRAKAVQPDA